MCCMARVSEKLRNYPKNHDGAAFYTNSYNFLNKPGDAL